MELGAETMKMARIAGLDYAKATDYMTASLRGFNMELNAESAEHINDVFSNLAAKTASNQQEMAEALTKTASIANSAGMSFETTSVLLAKMIETTRESPENLGTALKTVIGRFAEMKKATSDLITTEDGEVISVNRVDAALKSVGIQLKNSAGEFRSLDDVFLELSQRWDTLDIMSQRYIATQAAGSRQQSRFIAMMENYTRTQELLGYAYNSSGAAAEQFNKTMDSLEAKMNTLTNSWNTYTTTIANADIIKLTVDALNLLLTAVNTMVEILPGATKGIGSLLTALLGFKLIKPLITGVLFDVNKWIQETVAGKGVSEFSKGTKAGFKHLREVIFDKKTWWNDGYAAGTASANGVQAGINQTRVHLGVEGLTDDLKKEFENFKKLDAAAPIAEIEGSIGRLANGLHASQEQVDLFNDAIGRGIPAEKALLILQDNNVASSYSNAIANGVQTDSIEAETLATQRNSDAIAQNTARQNENGLSRAGLIQQAGGLLQVLFGVKDATRAAGAETLGLTYSTNIFAKALTGSKVAIGWYAAALISVTMAFRALAIVADRKNKAEVEAAKKILENVDSLQEEIDSVNELYDAYKKARDNYDGSAKSKREYIDATRELADEIGAEIKAEDLLAGNTKKINKEIRRATLENTKQSINSLEQQQAAANRIIEDAKYTQEKFGNLGFFSDWTRHIWGRESYDEATESRKQAEEALEKIKPQLQQQKFDAAYEQAKADSGIDFYATTYNEFGKFKTEIVKNLENIGFTKQEIESYLRQVISDTETEYNLVYESELDFKDRLKDYNIKIDDNELDKFIEKVREAGDTEILQEINLGKVKNVEQLQEAFDKAKGAFDAYKKANFGKSFIDATEILKAGKSFDDLSDTIKNKLNKELQKTKGIYNSLLTAQEEFNLLVNQGATNEAQTLYMLRLSNDALDNRRLGGNLLETIKEELDEAYTPQKAAYSKELQEATSVDLIDAKEFVNNVFESGKARYNKAYSQKLSQTYSKDTQVAANAKYDLGYLKKGFVEGAYMDPKQFVVDNGKVAAEYNMTASTFKPLIDLIEEAKNIDITASSDTLMGTALAIDQLLTQYESYDWGEDSESKAIFDEIKNNLMTISSSYKGIAGLDEEIGRISGRVANINKGLDEIRKDINLDDIENIMAGIFNEEAGSVIIEARDASLKGELDISENPQLYNILSQTLSTTSGFQNALEQWEYLVQYSDKETQSDFWRQILELVNDKSTELINATKERDIATRSNLIAFNANKDNSFESTKKLIEESNLSNASDFNLKDVKTYEQLARTINTYLEKNKDAEASFSGELAEVLQDSQRYLKNLDEINRLNEKISKNNYVTNQTKNVTAQVKNTIKEVNSALKETVSILSKIGDGFIVAADDAEALNEKFPGILQNATDLHDGTIQLSKEIVEAVIENDRKIVNSDYKKNDQILQDTIKELQTELQIEKDKKEAVEKRVQAIEGLNQDQSETAVDLSNQVKNVLNANQRSIVERDTIAKAIMGGNWEALTETMKAFPEELKDVLTDVYIEYQNIFNDALADTSKKSIASQLQLQAIAAGITEEVDWTKAIPGRLVDRGTEISYYTESGVQVDITREMEKLIRQMSAIKTEKVKKEDTSDTSNNKPTQSTANPNNYTIQDLLEGSGSLSIDDVKDITAASIEIYDAQIKAIEQNIKRLEDQKTAALLRNQEYNRSVDNLLAGLGGDPNKDVRDRDKSDPLYNIKSELAQLQKAYDDAQQAYTDLLNNPNSTAEQIQAGVDKVNAARKALTQGENVFKSSALNEIDKLIRAYPEFANLYSLNRETGQLTINNAGIDSLPTTTKEKFDNFFGKLESYVDSFAEGLDSITDLHHADEEFNTVWDTGYKSFVNLLQRIEEREAYQEKLDSDYEALLESRNVNAKKVSELLSASVQNLNEQLQLYSDLEKAQQYDLDSYVAQNKSFQKYVTYDKEHNAIRINNDALKQITNKEQLEAISKIIEEIKTRKEAHDETNKKISEVKKTLQEQQDKGRDEYITLVNKIRDIVKESRQQEIDRLENINDSINEANSRLMDAVRENIDKIRQDRKNEKTEQEIGNTAAKLAYLSQSTDVTTDTKEILDLRKSLEDQTESYSDTLVDQQLSNVEKANEKAQQQREDQIKLLTDQLEQDEKIGALMAQAERELETLTKSDGTFNQAAEILTKLKTAEGYEGLSKVEKMKWLDDFKKEVAQAGGYTRTANQLENLNIKKGTTIQFEDGNGNLLTGTYQGDDKGTVTVRRNNKEYSYDNVYQGQDKLYRTDYGPSSVSTINSQTPKTSTEKVTPKTEKTHVKPSDTVTLKSGSKYYPDPTTPSSNGTWDQTLDHKVDAINGKRMHLVSLKGGYTSWVDIDSIDKINGIKAYKTGGLVTDTGLAWLDGTRANPEYVLNADITKLMFETLGHLQDMQSTKKQISNSILSKTQNIGATNVEININVDKISSDYDVTQLAEQIKQNIAAESMYRNVNTINFLR